MNFKNALNNKCVVLLFRKRVMNLYKKHIDWLWVQEHGYKSTGLNIANTGGAHPPKLATGMKALSFRTSQGWWWALGRLGNQESSSIYRPHLPIITEIPQPRPLWQSNDCPISLLANATHISHTCRFPYSSPGKVVVNSIPSSFYALVFQRKVFMDFCLGMCRW